MDIKIWDLRVGLFVTNFTVVRWYSGRYILLFNECACVSRLFSRECSPNSCPSAWGKSTRYYLLLHISLSERTFPLWQLKAYDHTIRWNLTLRNSESDDKFCDTRVVTKMLLKQFCERHRGDVIFHSQVTIVALEKTRGQHHAKLLFTHLRSSQLPKMQFYKFEKGYIEVLAWNGWLRWFLSISLRSLLFVPTMLRHVDGEFKVLPNIEDSHLAFCVDEMSPFKHLTLLSSLAFRVIVPTCLPTPTACKPIPPSRRILA